MSQPQHIPEDVFDPFRGVDMSTDTEEPSSHVDDRIFAMARAELESRARGERRRVRWIEIGMAAAILLVAVLLFRDWGEAPGSVDESSIDSPFASSVAVGNFVGELLDGASAPEDHGSTPAVAVATLGAELIFLRRVASTAPIENESEKNQILLRLERCLADTRELQARLGMKVHEYEKTDPTEGGPR